MKFKQDVLFRVTVDVNGKQEYVFNTSDYDHLCDKLTDVMIKETLWQYYKKQYFLLLYLEHFCS